MGYGGTMEAWDPRFVDALAQRFRVVIFDNAGIGLTRKLPAPLTIDAMADQTSALIDALGLGSPDVLGWSMGGMIAQALAVRHPDQVRRLVLCASFPGTGKIALPPHKAIQALTSGNPQRIMADLFPADQTMAYDAFAVDTSSYANQPTVAAATIAAQARASLEWFDGADPTGRQTASIAAPTLIADGTVDRLDPVFNDHVLAGVIRGARLALYPEAGHAFLFQEGMPFVLLVDSFLIGSPTPLSLSKLRNEFLTQEARVGAAETTWHSELATLPVKPTSTQVAALDRPLASALTQLDYQLLSSGATGSVGAAISGFAAADEQFVDDVTALSVQTPSRLRSWTTTTETDAAAVKDAAASLRAALGLTPPSASAG
jgi:pimeloyl-ACP methyl ester carboxylesterase